LRVERGHISLFFFGGLLFWLKKTRDFLWISPLNHPVKAGTGASPINLVFPPNKLAVLGPTSVGRPEIWEQLKVLPLLRLLILVVV